MKDYEDIVTMNWTGVRSHERMREDVRAKLFLPFSAVKGHTDIIDDRQKVLTARRILSEDEKELLDLKLKLLENVEAAMAIEVLIEVFCPVENHCGYYHYFSGFFKKIDSVEQKMVLDCGIFDLHEIWDVHCELFQELEPCDRMNFESD